MPLPPPGLLPPPRRKATPPPRRKVTPPPRGLKEKDGQFGWQNFRMTPTPFMSPEESQGFLVRKWYINAGIEYYFAGDLKKAHATFLIGARDWKCIRCLTWIGICFLNGTGGLKMDLSKAKIALERASDQGDHLASMTLSRLYEKQKDKGRASWYRGDIASN